MEGSVIIRLPVILTVLITLSEVIRAGVFGCPEACLCYVDDGGLRTANCTDVLFISENKYSKVFHEIGVLNIETDNDKPITLWDDMFKSFTKLKFLNLQNCKINYLPKNVFKGLKKVFEINLSSNDIKHFDNTVFENIYALNKLNLRGNRIQGSSKPFISSSTLRELDLGYCSMTNIQNEFFHGVKKIARLYLDGNHLQTIKEHVLPSRITHLNLANNRIINVPISTINSLSQLRWLDLRANPINCTCSLMNLQDILSGHATIIEGDIICAYPIELENMNLSKVNENEVCNKEAFSSRYNLKKSQTTKYSSYPKKDYYFENEKYDPFEIQGDDPGISTDDYVIGNETIYNQSKEMLDTKVYNEVKDEVEDSSQIAEKQDNDHDLLDTKSKSENEDITSQTPPDTDTLLANLSSDGSTNFHDVEIKVNESESEKLPTEKAAPNVNDNDEDDRNEEITKDGLVADEDTKNETTPLPDSLSSEMLPLPVNPNNDKSGDLIDESMKKDQVMPVGTLPNTEHTSSEKMEFNESNAETSTKNHSNDVKLQEHEEDNSDKTTPKVQENNKDKTIKENEYSGVEEGSGGSYEENVFNSSIPIINEENLPDVSEEPDHNHHHGDTEKSEGDENENVGQIVDKKPINYEEMGPIIVVVCIIVFITILVFIALYKGACKSKETNRKPVGDVEASNGTELQDIALLPKSPVNDEKHNNKYPHEVPSPETVSLIKADKTEETNGLNHSHDLNQNDNKNDPIIKNGKRLDASPLPIEKTTAKLTVLHESIPKTPILVQKIPATVNNS